MLGHLAFGYRKRHLVGNREFVACQHGIAAG
jgi:hypothetical protein